MDNQNSRRSQVATARRHRQGRVGHALAALAVVTTATVLPVVISEAPANAAVSNCSKGLNNANKAWGTCTSGSGTWSLTVQCYYWGANTSYGNGPGSIYATCPPSSHVTDIILRTNQ